jgi:DNA-3-methyladenine glycosylase I
MKPRCTWAGNDELYIKYHDQEWGIPVFDDLKLFEMLILEGAQAGLSWITVLKKRDNYRAAFDRFDVAKIISYNEKKIGQLLADKGIIRNRLKIDSVIKNAHAFLRVSEEYGNFSKYIWSFVDGKPIVNHWKNMNDIPSNTAESDAMSKDMKKRGFKFVGTTICYAYMQAVGMVNDHLVDCFRYNDLA